MKTGRVRSLATLLSSRALGLTRQMAAVYCDMKRYPNAVAPTKTPLSYQQSDGLQGTESAEWCWRGLTSTNQPEECMNSHGRQFSIASSCVCQV